MNSNLKNIVDNIKFGHKFPCKVLKVEDMIATCYEPKTKFRWILVIEGIDSFFVKNAQRPKFIKNKDFVSMQVEPLHFEFYDPITPSGSQQIYNWVENQSKKRDGKLMMLDPLGAIVEEWDLMGLELIYADFGNLNYDNKEPATIAIGCKCQSAKLYY